MPWDRDANGFSFFHTDDETEFLSELEGLGGSAWVIVDVDFAQFFGGGGRRKYKTFSVLDLAEDEDEEEEDEGEDEGVRLRFFGNGGMNPITLAARIQAAGGAGAYFEQGARDSGDFVAEPVYYVFQLVDPPGG